MVQLSTLAQNNLLRAETLKVQTEIARLQNQASTGKKSDNYGDLGTLAPLDISLRNKADRIAEYQTANKSIAARLAVVDGNLSSIEKTVLDVRNVAFANHGSDIGRQSIIDAAKQAIRDVTQKLQVNVDGRFLFGGTRTDQPPMVDDATLMASTSTAVTAALTPTPADISGTVATTVAGIFGTTANFYQGLGAHPAQEIDENLRLDYSITGGNSAVQKILQGLYAIALTPMPTDEPTRQNFDQGMNNAGTLISDGLGELQQLILKNGRNQKLLEDQNTLHEQSLTLITTQVDDIENVDLADVSTRLTHLRTQLQASYSITADLKDLSLVNFLR